MIIEWKVHLKTIVFKFKEQKEMLTFPLLNSLGHVPIYWVSAKVLPAFGNVNLQWN